jgi:hypothetical protein
VPGLRRLNIVGIHGWITPGRVLAARHELAQALHAVANLGGKAPAAVVHTAPGREPSVVLGPDLPAVLASLNVRDVGEFNALHGSSGESVRIVRELRFVE